MLQTKTGARQGEIASETHILQGVHVRVWIQAGTGSSSAFPFLLFSKLNIHSVIEKENYWASMRVMHFPGVTVITVSKREKSLLLWNLHSRRGWCKKYFYKNCSKVHCVNSYVELKILHYFSPSDLILATRSFTFLTVEIFVCCLYVCKIQLATVWTELAIKHLKHSKCWHRGLP